MNLLAEIRGLSFADAKELVKETAYNLDVTIPTLKSWEQLKDVIDNMVQPVIAKAREEKRQEKRTARTEFMESVNIGDEFTKENGDVVQVIEKREHVCRVEYVYAVDEFQTMQCGDCESIFANRMMKWVKTVDEPLMLPNTKGERNLDFSFESISSIDVVAKEWFDGVNGNSYNSVRFDVYSDIGRCIEVVLPFAYGYGDYYMQRVEEYCKKHFGLERITVHELVVCNVKKYYCLKRQVIAHGEL